MTPATEEEQWARLVVFLLVGLYIFIITSIMIRFLIKTCALRNDILQQRCSHDMQIRFRAPETPPPQFLAALKCPLPKRGSLGSIAEETPPSYEQACAKNPAPKQFGPQNIQPKKLDPNDISIHF